MKFNTSVAQAGIVALLFAGVTTATNAQQPTPEPYKPPKVNTAPAPKAAPGIRAGSLGTGKPQAGSLSSGKPSAGSLSSGKPRAGSMASGIGAGSLNSGVGAGSLAGTIGQSTEPDSLSRRGRRSGRSNDDDDSPRTRSRSPACRRRRCW